MLKFKLLMFLAIVFAYPMSLSANELSTIDVEVQEMQELQEVEDIEEISEVLEIASNLAVILTEILNTYRGEVTLTELYQSAIIGMTERLDEFSRFFSEEEFMVFSGNTSGYTVAYGFIIAQDSERNVVVYSVFENSVAESIGIRNDDIIESINDTEVKGLALDVVLEIINSNPNPDLHINIARGGEVETFVLSKGAITHRTVSVTHFNDIFYSAEEDSNDHIRHVSISRMGHETPIELKKYIEIMQSEGVESIVLDLRGNLGGHLETAIEMSNMLIPESTIMYIVDSSGSKYEIYTDLGNMPFENIIVIVDRNTASSAEIIAAALQDSGSTVVGETTYGKGLVQTALEIPGGGVLTLTTHESFRGNGNPINNIGITPDIYITSPDFLMRVGLDYAAIFKHAMEILDFFGYEVGDITNQQDKLNLQALQNFQLNHDLEVTHIIDIETTSALNEMLFILHLETDYALETAYKLLI